MADKRTGPSRRTRAQREAINARAAAWPRPLSAWQVSALAAMAKQELWRTRAGWICPKMSGRRWQRQTVAALAQRGLCTIVANNRFAVITPAGRRELRKARP